MVKVGIDRAHRLTPSRSAPSKRHISSIMVLYTHDSRFLQAASAAKKVTVADLEPLAERSGFSQRELMKFLKPFQKLLNPATKGVDLLGFSEYLSKTLQLDPSDDKLCKRLFDVQNTRNGYYLLFEQVLELLEVLKKGDTADLANLFWSVVDHTGTGWVAMSEVVALFEPPDRGPSGQLDIVKERRKMTIQTIMNTIYTVLEKKKDARISQEEFMNAVALHPDVTRFFDRIGFLIMRRPGRT